jgi:hypothetical protein
MQGLPLGLWNIETGDRKVIGRMALDRLGRARTFSPDGRILVLDVEADGPAVWDVRAGRSRRLPPTTGELPFVFTPDSRGVVTKVGRRVTLIDTETLEPRWVREYIEPESPRQARAGEWGVAVFRRDGRVEVLDPQTGEPTAELPVLPDGISSDLGSSLHIGGPMVTATVQAKIAALPAELQPGPWRRWVRKVLGYPPTVDYQSLSAIVDLRTGRSVFTFEDSPRAWASNTGNYVLTTTGGSDAILTCLDVPPRKPWRWVVGPPLALAALAVALNRAWAWRRRRRAAVAAG